MAELTKITIGDLGRIVTGKTPPVQAPERFGQEYPFLTPSDMDEMQRHVEPSRFLSRQGYERHRTQLLPENAICVVCIGATIGKVCMTSRASFSNQQINSIIVDSSKYDPRFVYYLLTTLRDDLRSKAGGAATPIINKSAFSEIAIRLPALKIQSIAADVLSAYDALIENNQRRMRILEEMARSLYREWFVHFRFPGHENHLLVSSALGDIPQGWAVREFGDVFNVQYGKTLPKSEVLEAGKYPVYGAGDVIGFYDKALYSQKCALITSRGNGSGTVWRTRQAAFVTNNSLSVVTKEGMPVWDSSFIVQFLLHANVMSAKTGSAQPQVTIANLNYVKGIVPDETLIDRFQRCATLWQDQVDTLFRMNANLRKTRDLLLPRLLSGQIKLEAH